MLKHSMPRLAAFFSLALSNGLTSAQQLIDPTSKDNSPNCSCYVTLGPQSGYFQHYRFFDFRDVPSDSNNDYRVAPILITDLQDYGSEPVTSAFLNTTDWNDNWSIQNWQSNATADSPIRRVNSAQNIYLSRNTTDGSNNSTYLTFRATRLQKFVSISELASQQKNLKHYSIRSRIRILPSVLTNQSAPAAGYFSRADPLFNTFDSDLSGDNSSHPVATGAVASLFTYYSDTDESDIEILTHDPINTIRYSNQPDYDTQTDTSKPGASTEIATPFNWTDWNEHRIDWYDDQTYWWINGQLQHNTSINLPKTPMGLILNLWSDGGKWSGNMTIGSQVLMAVEWIEMSFNTSGDAIGPKGGSRGSKRSEMQHLFVRKDSGCDIACSIDDVSTIGHPEIVLKITSAAIMVAPGSVRHVGTYILFAALAITYNLLL